MKNLEDEIRIRAKNRHSLIEKHIDQQSFIDICVRFNKFDDDRRFIPFDVCDIIQVCQLIGFKEPLTSGLQLILLTSIIELLNTKEYVKFPSWYKKNIEIYKEIDCHKAYGEWEKQYSTSKNFRNFFYGLTKEEKVNLLTKMYIQHEEENFYAPFCYHGQEQCFYGSISCKGENSLYECLTHTNEKHINEGIKRFANVLYGLRSNFVHKAKIPMFSEPNPPLKVGEYVLQVGRMTAWSILRTNEYTGWCSMTLYADDLYELVLKYLKKMFIDYYAE